MDKFLKDETGFYDFITRSRVAYVVTSVTGQFILANQAFADTFGYTPDELKTLGVAHLTHPDDRERSFAAIRVALAGTDESFLLEKRYLHHDGHEILAESHITLVRSETGDPRFFITSVFDVTAAREDARRLAESENRYRQLFENLQEGFALNEVVLGDGRPVDLRFLATNAAFGRHMGLAPRAVVGKTMLEVNPKADPRQIEAFARVALDGEPYNVEYYSQALGRWLNVRTFRPAPGQVAGIFEDVTDRKRMEELLQRTDKLEALGLLAGGIAHDFNNLLAGVFNWVSLAQQQAGPDTPAGKSLGRALGMSDRARALTQQLLTFAKGGAPQVRTEALAPVVRQNTTFVLSGSSVTARFDLADDLWPCDFDPNQIGQVVDNLVLNAVQALPGGGQVTWTARNHVAQPSETWLEPGRYVALTLQDNGPGIPEAVLPRIFDPFFTTKATGTGLGLSTCHSIVTKHGGQITAESSSRGTAFHVYLPASSGVPLAGVSSRDAAQGQGRLLLVDDEAELRETVSALLERLGYEVVATATAAEAYELVKSSLAARPFDGAVLDLTLPGGEGGRSLVGRLKALAPELKVFATSGYSEDAVMANPRAHGFDGCIAKPCTVAELAAVFEGQFTRR